MNEHHEIVKNTIYINIIQFLIAFMQMTTRLGLFNHVIYGSSAMLLNNSKTVHPVNTKSTRAKPVMGPNYMIQYVNGIILFGLKMGWVPVVYTNVHCKPFRKSNSSVILCRWKARTFLCMSWSRERPFHFIWYSWSFCCLILGTAHSRRFVQTRNSQVLFQIFGK